LKKVYFYIIGVIFLVIGLAAFVNAENKLSECDVRYQEIINLRSQFAQYIQQAQDKYLQTGDPYWLNKYSEAYGSYLDTFEAETLNDNEIFWANQSKMYSFLLVGIGIFAVFIGIIIPFGSKEQKTETTSKESSYQIQSSITSEPSYEEVSYQFSLDDWKKKDENSSST